MNDIIHLQAMIGFAFKYLSDQYWSVYHSYSWFSIFRIVSVKFRLKTQGDSGHFVPLHFRYWTKFSTSSRM